MINIFEFNRNTLNVKEIYDRFTSEKYIVDNTYQRRKVWVPKDKTRLIETILLNYVIPEIYLWPADINPTNGETITHIVDGQQRINAIVDFISGKLTLKSIHLLNDEVKKLYGNKKFIDLPIDIKKDFWQYKLSIVNIDRKCTIDDIKAMFFRLNITDYSLTEQEKRHSLDNEFGDASLSLSHYNFWNDMSIFSANDVKRMKDVQYCSDILILADEGIVDQASVKKLNQVYEDNQEEFHNKNLILESIDNAILIIMTLHNEKTEKFLKKKIQLYTAFSVAFNLLEEGFDVDDKVKRRFNLFVEVYELYNSSSELHILDENTRSSLDMVNRYRLASSEGVHKLGNRMIRFEVLKKILFIMDDSIESNLETLVQQLKVN